MKPALQGAGERRIPPRRSSALTIFAIPDFRLLWTGMLVGNLGTWMQFTALTYLLGVVLADSPAHSALNLGLLGASQAIPVLLVSTFAGYVADKYPRKQTLLIANGVRVLLASGLAFISQFHGEAVLIPALVIAALFAAANSFDNPARNSWVSFIVPRQSLVAAIGFSSIAFNAPQVVGPAIAGILIATIGIHASFWVNAAAQAAVVLMVAFMHPSPVMTMSSEETMLGQIAAGARYLAQHAVLRWILLGIFLGYLLVRPYTWLLADFSGHILNLDAKAYGTMLAAGGVGTVLGAIACAFWRSERRTGFWFVTAAMTAIGLMFLGYLHNMAAIVILLTVMGFGAIANATMTGILLQTLCPEELRGRAVAIQTMFGQGIIPLGTLLMGSLAAAVGLPLAYAMCGSAGLAVAVWAYFTHPAVRKA